MSEREAQRRTGRDAPEEFDEEITTTSVEERKEQIDEDVDSILDEIDEVLETNAAEFIASFVQKGGQ